MNAWFPKINAAGQIASGSNGIWLTDKNGSRQVSPVGTGPAWAGSVLVFNRNDGATTDFGGTTIRVAYNEIIGSDDERWAGFVADAFGRTETYRGVTRTASAPTVCAPRFGGDRFAYLAPYQAETRNLVIDNVTVATGRLVDVRLTRGGEFYVYLTATGTYTRQIFDPTGKVVNIRDDEEPLVVFMGPGAEAGTRPWMLSRAGEVAFVRPVNSAVGYVIEGELYYPDARMFGEQLRIVASLHDGAARFDVWVDFNQPRQDLRNLDPTFNQPEFEFNHPVLIAPFKDPKKQAGTQYRMEDGSLGIYTEAEQLSDAVIAEAEKLGVRILLGHDAPTLWVPPDSLREWDLPGVELYRDPTESLQRSAERWRRQVVSLLGTLKGVQQCFVIPMFYGQWNAETASELWSEQDVLDGLAYLSDIVNLSPRITVISPFAFERANGITAHPASLGVAFNNLKAAAPPGVALVPVPGPTPPDPPDPPDPPKPDPKPSIYYTVKEYSVPNEEVGAIKVGPNFGRVVSAFAGQGPFGWYKILFDRETPDDDCWWTLTKPDAHHELMHTKVPCRFGGDQKEAEDFMFYGQPKDKVRGILESPILMNDPTGSGLIIGVFTWPNRHLTGGVAAPSFAWIKR